MRVAAWQAPLGAREPGRAIARIREQVRRCEEAGVEILCCPEAVLGGLADDATPPDRFAIDAGGGRLEWVLAPLASDRVTTIVGFTERGAGGRLHNAAAVFRRGEVLGVYRKLHPAIRRSVYEPGTELPVFTVSGLTFGIVICRDSNFPGPARTLAALGARALFVPTNNGLPPGKGGPELVGLAREADVARATENGITVVRADVAGRARGLVSWGSSGIVDPGGRVLRAARPLRGQLLVAEIGTEPTGAEPRRSAPGYLHPWIASP